MLSQIFYAVNEVYYQRLGEDYCRLTPSSREELDVLDEAWQSLVGRTYTDTGTGVITYNYDSKTSQPTHYYWDREEDNLGIYPPPNDDNDGALLKVYYSRNIQTYLLMVHLQRFLREYICQ